MEEKNPKKILIVEDSQDLALNLAIRLKSQGYLAIVANDALYGVSLAHNERPDLIILDLGLPAGGGFFVIENLKKSIETNIIPILVLTARQEKELEERAFQMGVAAYFHKPFNLEELLSRIKEILNNK